MSDRIDIRRLSLHAYHGVMPHEAKVGQTFAIDMALAVDLSAGAASDKLADTVPYHLVIDVAREAFCGRRYQLIEAAAGAVATAVLRKFAKVEDITVTIHKPHAPVAATFDDIAVTIVRRRKDLKDG